MLSKILAAAMIGLAVIAGAAAETKGPHGGVIVVADEHPIEMVVSAQDLTFYLGGHDGKPMSTKGVKGRAVVQSGGKTFTIALSSEPPDRLVGKLSAPLAPKARVVFSSMFDGHNLQARFSAP